MNVIHASIPGSSRPAVAGRRAAGVEANPPCHRRLVSVGAVCCAVLAALAGGPSADRVAPPAALAQSREALQLGVVGTLDDQVTALSVGADRLYVAEGGRITIWTADHPPRFLGSTDRAASRILAVAPLGDHVYAVHAGAGLRIYDVRDPASPISLAAASAGALQAARSVHMVADQGRLYVASRRGAPSATGGPDTALQIADLSRPDGPTWIADLPGLYGAIAVRDRFVYVLDPVAALHVVDATDPPSARVVGRLALLGKAADPSAVVEPQRIAVAGSTVFVGVEGLVAVDVGDPTAPRTVGWMRTAPGSRAAVAMSGDHALVVDRNLAVVDVHDPAAPRALDQTPDLLASGELAYLAAHEGVAYVAGTTSPVRIVDARRPSDGLRFLGSAALRATVARVQGERAYVAQEGDGLSVLDLRDGPAVIGVTAPVSLSVLAVDVVGELVYAAVQGMSGLYGWEYGLAVLDASDPANVREIARITGTALPGSGIDVAGGHAFVVGTDHTRRPLLAVFDVREPARPSQVGVLELPPAIRRLAVSVEGDLACIAYDSFERRRSGVLVVSVHDVRQPRLMATIGGLDRWPDVYLWNQHAFIAAGEYMGLRVYDVGDPARPIERPYARVPIYAEDLDGCGPMLAVVGSGRVVLFDVSNPLAPTEVSVYTPNDGDPTAVALSEKRMLVAKWVDIGTSLPTLHADALDVSAPGGLAVRQMIAPLAPLTDIAVEDGTLVAAVGRDGIRVADVRRPDAPWIASRPYPDGPASAVALVQGRAYVTPFRCPECPLRILDVGNLRSPLELGTHRADSEIHAVAVDGGMAYVILYHDSGWLGVARALQLVDVRDPSSPRLIAEGNLCEIDESWDVAAGGGLAYLSVKSRLYVLDSECRNVPQWSGRYDLPEPVVDVAVRDRTVFVLTAHRIVVLDATDPAAIDLQGEVRWASGASAVKGAVATGELSGVPMLSVSTSEALWLYDVTDPAAPALVASYTYASGNDRYVALALDGDCVYGAPARGGLEVLGLREAGLWVHGLFLPTALRAASRRPFDGATAWPGQRTSF